MKIFLSINLWNILSTVVNRHAESNHALATSKKLSKFCSNRLTANELVLNDEKTVTVLFPDRQKFTEITVSSTAVGNSMKSASKRI